MKKNQIKLKELLMFLDSESYRFYGNDELIIEGMTWDPGRILPNSLYFCLEKEEFQEPHIKENSFNHWEEAIEKGALCLVAEANRIKNIPNGIGLIEVGDVNKTMALLSQKFYQDPFAKMKVVGVTGTNGKTTTTQFLDSIFNRAGWKNGVIGTIGVFYPDNQQDAGYLSNPLSTDLFSIGSRMAEQNVELMMMEVTSHAMSFERNISIDYDVAIFTNLTQDHLDYHKTFDAYKQEKLKLFAKLGKMNKPGYGIINIDDAYGADFIRAIDQSCLNSGQAKVITYGIRNKEADLVAYPKQMTGSFSEFDLIYRGDFLGTVRLPMTGLFNIYNALASFGAAFALGLPIEQIIEGLEKVTQVCGRFEKVNCSASYDVFVDYAHTPDSLVNILSGVREITRNRVICLFGCGGDRDRTKRPLMGEAAARNADICIITSDNPRTEDAEKIIKDICPGMQELEDKSLFIEIDREKAIHLALSLAEPGDSVLIAGKGHETYQIIGTTKYPFSDRKKVEEYFIAKDLEESSPRAWIELSKSKLKRNFKLINQDKPKGLNFLAVVKDDALGHGIIEMSREAINAGAHYLGVACLSEAIEIRESGIDKFPILLLGERSKSEIPVCVQHDLTLQVQSLEVAELVGYHSAKQEKTAKLHFKVDTGMGRYGVRWDKAVEEIEKILKVKNTVLEGVMTHFAQSDEAVKDYANLQWERFQTVLKKLEEKSISIPLVHTCNTGGYLDLPHAHGNMVRLGILPTGVYPSKVCRRINLDGETLTPVMSVKSQVAFLKYLEPEDRVGYGMHFKTESQKVIAVLPFGYGDGFPRLRNNGYVLIHGVMAPIVGGNSMDATMVDVTDIPDVKVSDEVVIIGKQGDSEISSVMLADWSGTVCYDILSGWNKRMKRKWVD